jgi:hypothetical protein
MTDPTPALLAAQRDVIDAQAREIDLLKKVHASDERQAEKRDRIIELQAAQIGVLKELVKTSEAITAQLCYVLGVMKGVQWR